MSQFQDSFSNPGYGGGGYIQGGSPFNAGGSPGMRRTEASHSLRPLTIAQLIKATQTHTDADWMVDDMEVGQITIVGQVQSIQSQATNCVYWIDDGTGRIESRRWLDTSVEEDKVKWGNIEENDYIRVTGGLKTFGNKRYVNATHIRVIKDPHEVYFHILEAISVSLILERGPPPGPGQLPRSNGEGSMANTSAYTAQSSGSIQNDEFSHLPPLQLAIVRFILAQNPGGEGVHVAAIARAIGPGVDAHKISDALDILMDEGHVFSTIDDSHFNVSR